VLVPWRHPTVAIVYVRRAIDLSSARLVPAEGRADASLLVRVTDDASLLRPFAPWPLELDGVPLADPVQQWRAFSSSVVPIAARPRVGSTRRSSNTGCRLLHER